MKPFIVEIMSLTYSIWIPSRNNNNARKHNGQVQAS